MKETNLDAVLEQRSPEDKKLKLRQTLAEVNVELKLSHLREELQITQQELAHKLNISQPSVVALEKRGNDIKLSSIQRYIDAIGGKIHLAVSLPTGKSVIYRL
ncbi:helix-turn-helix domain-containing protein [Actinobacillus equuli subsp. equuli]|uniref:Transcriptional regulator n=1 Tax=Actinobacillus equuli TaxID=718 RepID=A0AAX3FMC2_ACTEU|nr:XRE family transcriptional regulator [Actinobacillus equuli]AIZ80102.1 XRE family transcriptional regulator [Actinobacillus equuli subsp. equuli]MDG4953343.1 helix-turn-helix domain-containing protein [Actinobacillus equuli subsp. equuli]WGE44212.1 helix-turn-helix domain-containing protein [Actinobacillus equuli subsp. equuli]WGE48462.1 helix-turn-helix domain-containing protein [Actinobacillus equuli subsp. equuli]WGE54843.1 helix-turn-helix domain-containing protein [Actinobacillus equul